MTEHGWTVGHQTNVSEHRYRATCVCGWEGLWYADIVSRKRSGAIVHSDRQAEYHAACEGLAHVKAST